MSTATTHLSVHGIGTVSVTCTDGGANRAARLEYAGTAMAGRARS